MNHFSVIHPTQKRSFYWFHRIQKFKEVCEFLFSNFFPFLRKMLIRRQKQRQEREFLCLAEQFNWDLFIQFRVEAPPTQIQSYLIQFQIQIFNGANAVEFCSKKLYAYLHVPCYITLFTQFKEKNSYNHKMKQFQGDLI